ncbi:Acetyltransferase (GNAT) domain-containing protein [Paenibacillus algorifonticola]|uniref:Acetyltransferase (GNAT) domain-containing protein n=1 Tax=Paenibacillus algorifonticola TaxID=684063 RepID=A0A1I2F545_9BACL|nr:GNAT family N-acetyltransferase [Paenibacillus algorifonticola]SFF00285.1 Acetyltransferase (GNAT) domain-containing protein [Paenibacillus algorifonticola]
MGQSLRVEELTELNEHTLEELAGLIVEVVEDGASIGFLPPLSREDAKAYWQGVLEPGTLLWVAKEGQQIVGTVQLQLAQKQNASHRAEIAKMMVQPQQRRKGIARLLMQEAEERAVVEGRSLLVLDTLEGAPSNILYQSLGFIEAGRIPKFARSGDGSLYATVLYYKEI